MLVVTATAGEKIKALLAESEESMVRLFIGGFG